MYKLIVSDIDGTLVGWDEKINAKIIALVNELRRHGVEFTLVSGRVEQKMTKFIEPLSIRIPYGTSNGARILQNNQLIMEKNMKVGPLKEIIERALNLDISVIYTINGMEYAYNETQWVLEEREKFGYYQEIMPFTNVDWENLSIEKLMLMDWSQLRGIHKLIDIVSDLPVEYYSTRYSNRAIEVVDQYANKATAVKFIADNMGVELHEVIAIGDHVNDLEMLSEVGLGIAVGNAIDEVKEAADLTVEKREGEAVVEVLERVLEQIKSRASGN